MHVEGSRFVPRAGGVCNKELARLDLDRLGMIPSLFRSTLYVMNSFHGAMVVLKMLSHKYIFSLSSATYTSGTEKTERCAKNHTGMVPEVQRGPHLQTALGGCRWMGKASLSHHSPKGLTDSRLLLTSWNK